VTVLTKRDVQALMADYDSDPVAALTAALRVVLDRPDGDWTGLVKAAGFGCAQRIRLQAADPSALDELLIDLNETRTVDQPSRP